MAVSSNDAWADFLRPLLLAMGVSADALDGCEGVEIKAVSGDLLRVQLHLAPQPVVVDGLHCHFHPVETYRLERVDPEEAQP